MAIRTIFSMTEDCARGERQGWLEFVCNFAGIARALLRHYFPTLIPNLDGNVVAVFRRAGAQTSQRTGPGHAGGPTDGSWFASLNFNNEREFMMAFRDLVLAYGREQERLAPQHANTGRVGGPVVPGPQVALDQVRAMMKDLGVLEQEMLWLCIKGYDSGRIAAIMMNAVATAEAVKRIADQRLAALVPGAEPEALSTSGRVLMESAEQLRTDQCPSLKTFNNLVNGQITWREREAAEQHMKDCFYCIDRFTTFQEMVRFRKDVPPLSQPAAEAILAQLPFAAGKPRGVLSRLLSGR